MMVVRDYSESVQAIWRALRHASPQRRGMQMPSFDVVSEANMIEVKNAIEQSNKEIATRFDFKG